MRRRAGRLGAAVAAVAVVACAQPSSISPASDPSPEFYLRWSLVGDKGEIVAPGRLTLAGRRMECAGRATVLNPYLDDYAEAFPRFIVLNPTRMRQVSPAVQWWIYGHECGHEHLGPDEVRADCFGIEQGVREAWLTPQGLDRICGFIAVGHPDRAHPAGIDRCRLMRACYAAATMRRDPASPGAPTAPAR